MNERKLIFIFMIITDLFDMNSDVNKLHCCMQTTMVKYWLVVIMEINRACRYT